MSLNIGDNFSYLGAKPLDTRRVYTNKAALDAVSLSTVYEGMIVYVQSEDKYYRLKSGIWVEFSAGSGISDWTANTAYTVDDIVINSGTLYICTTAHTSGTTFDTTELTNWQEVGSDGGAGITDWDSSKEYKVGDIVYYNESLFKCNNAHTSSSTFDPDEANWILMYADLKLWKASKYYVVGTIVISSNGLYRCNTSHTSGSTFDTTELANWQYIGSKGIADWATSTSYAVGDIVSYNHILYFCNNAHTSNSFAADRADWTLFHMPTAKILNWATSTYYEINQLVIQDGNIYRCKTIHTSSSFDLDEANWEVIFASVNTWQGGLFYKVGTVAIYNNKIYHCKTAHTASVNFNATEEANWDAIGGKDGILNDWSTNTAYKINDIIRHDGEIYKCITAHTSDSTSFSNDISNWVLVNSVNDWTANTDYFVGQLILESGNLYRVISSFTSGATFSKTNLAQVKVLLSADTDNILQYKTDGLFCDDPEELTTAEVTALVSNFNPSGDGLMQLDNWEANHGYTAKQVVYYSNSIYRCKSNHTSGATFDNTEKAFWDNITGGSGTSIDNWASGTNYAVGDFVLYNNYIYKCSTANADTSFTPSKWQKLCEVPVWGSSIVYGVGDIVIESGMLYRCTTQHTSGSSFNTTEQANWSRLYKDFTGATSLADGKVGLVPKPVKGDEINFLCGDGTWKSIPYGGSGLIVQDNILWSGLFSSASSGSTLTLNDNFLNYDVILIVLNGQMITTLDPSYGSAFSVVTDGGSLGSTFSSEIVLTFNGTTATANFWNYGSSVASSSILIIGRNYINPNDFSTTERRIGTWIDGKPLYQITYEGTSTGSVAISISMLIDKIISIDGCTKITGVDYPLNYYINSTNYGSCVVGFDVSSGTSSRVIYLAHYAESRSYLINIKYTKL